MRRTCQGMVLSASMLAAVLGLTGCGSSGGDGSDNGTGYLSLGVSDAPVHDATKVCIAFDHIEFKVAGDGAPFTVDLGAVLNVNLLEFQGANAAPLLFMEPMPVGAYEYMRLGVNARAGGTGGTGDDPGSELCAGEESYIAFEDGTVHNLFVPSGDERGLQINGDFVIAVDQTANFTIEVDLMRSLVTPPGLAPDMIFKPTLKLVNNLEVGTLLGAVAAELATAVDPVTAEPCEPSIFVFADGVVPNEADVEDTEAVVSTAMVHPVDNGDGTAGHAYEVGYLVAGDYEVAFTCDGTVFEPADGKPATIAAGEVTTVDFP
ncbi:MAG TPA: DUF4382 domain-containing protein [Woeseiaceae bacterium]|nr:DUF4382 domain-containing protein [Woeseiaceae bacterium]